MSVGTVTRTELLAALKDERERAALLAEEMAATHRRSARRLREQGTSRLFGFGPRYVAREYEKAAKTLEAAAHSVRAVAMGIREGWDVRRLADSVYFGGPGPHYLPKAPTPERPALTIWEVASGIRRGSIKLRNEIGPDAVLEPTDTVADLFCLEPTK